MQDIKSYFESKLNQRVDEGKFPEMDIETFIDIVNGEIDPEDFDLDSLDSKYVDIIKNHCKILARGGGYDGDGSSWYEYLVDQGVDMDKLDVDEDSDVYSIFDDGELDLNVLKVIGDAVGMRNVKCGGCWFTSGYEAPTFVLFDIKNAATKDILKNLEGWY